jgi:hypothetical protein
MIVILFSLILFSLSLNVNTHAYHCVYVLMPLVIKELLGDNTHQAAPRLIFPLPSKASSDCITFYRIPLYSLYLMQWLYT